MDYEEALVVSSARALDDRLEALGFGGKRLGPWKRRKPRQVRLDGKRKKK